MIEVDKHLANIMLGGKVSFDGEKNGIVFLLYKIVDIAHGK